ncbi:MAG: 30S ribosomal protein S4 [Candidatus Magasanikbacteria bacterium CG11_big_fil_rev_8_21_14_0_20_43_7]|uniref:Small ribosomal subunit protein uS4 n=1 Tax=Candidatus Magasanikbacteria bacterium CG11_big_fil_rev_8_21_14_0_20_43_7 TaxID=1974654 RepID=A0A2H0N3J2_9BACT|nr:MAG: 30S ribosomal protein S4 [Candidatus Magasanikbacteria bacterium CG11_big_fil_rev_8_21_14_0_20_43_7]
MGRYIGPKNKIARRFGVNLGLKTNVAKVAKRLNQRPGQHGAKHKRSLSSFGKQLEEKQKAKFVYGLRERQFRAYVEEANRQEGDSGVNLNNLLEGRLDNVVYRMGYASTRAQARQLVNHGMFTVNAKKLDIPSYSTKVGDVIAVNPIKKNKKYFDIVAEQLANKVQPSWLSLDPPTLTGTVLGRPTKDEFEQVFDVKLIIEYYSTR